MTSHHLSALDLEVVSPRSAFFFGRDVPSQRCERGRQDPEHVSIDAHAVHVEVSTCWVLSLQFAPEGFFTFHAGFLHRRPQSDHDLHLELCVVVNTRWSSEVVCQGRAVSADSQTLNMPLLMHELEFFTRGHAAVGASWDFWLAVHGRGFLHIPRHSFCRGLETPATETMLANSWMLEKSKMRPDERLHDTRGQNVWDAFSHKGSDMVRRRIHFGRCHVNQLRPSSAHRTKNPQAPTSLILPLRP